MSPGYPLAPCSQNIVREVKIERSLAVSETTQISKQTDKLDTPMAAHEQEVADVIAQLEQYKARLIEDFTATAKKAKLPKSMTIAQLKSHPEILKIDASLAQLRGEDPADSHS